MIAVDGPTQSFSEGLVHTNKRSLCDFTSGVQSRNQVVWQIPYSWFPAGTCNSTLQLTGGSQVAFRK